jgi:hypothetical protein
MGTLGVGIMYSMTFSPSSKNNSKIDGNQITFAVIDFQTHPPTLAPVFANLDQEMDLIVRSFIFCVRSLGSVCLSDLINLGPLAGKTANMVTSGTSVGSSNEINSLASIKPTKSKHIRGTQKNHGKSRPKRIIELLGCDFRRNFNNISSYSKEDFIACHGNISNNSEDTWRSGLMLHDDEQTIFSLGSSHYTGNLLQLFFCFFLFFSL